MEFLIIIWFYFISQNYKHRFIQHHFSKASLIESIPAYKSHKAFSGREMQVQSCTGIYDPIIYKY